MLLCFFFLTFSFAMRYVFWNCWLSLATSRYQQKTLAHSEVSLEIIVCSVFFYLHVYGNYSSKNSILILIHTFFSFPRFFVCREVRLLELLAKFNDKPLPAEELLAHIESLLEISFGLLVFLYVNVWKLVLFKYKLQIVSLHGNYLLYYILIL